SCGNNVVKGISLSARLPRIDRQLSETVEQVLVFTLSYECDYTLPEDCVKRSRPVTIEKYKIFGK
ncbi:MAG: hypothetical protein R3307_08140, partial [Anaerolineales bacterium]|nr:hypothetical protein [Anaerolineales bacterium]